MTTSTVPLAAVIADLAAVGRKLVETSESALALLEAGEAECRPSPEAPMPTVPILLTKTETLALLRMGERTFSRLRADARSKFPAPVRGRPLRWRRGDVERWLEGRKR